MKVDFENALQQEPVQAILMVIMTYTTESERQIIYEKLGRRVAQPPTSPDIVAEAALLYPTCDESAPSLNERQMARRAAHISCAQSYEQKVKGLEAEVENLQANLDAAKQALNEILGGSDFPLSIAQNALRVLGHFSSPTQTPL